MEKNEIVGVVSSGIFCKQGYRRIDKRLMSRCDKAFDLRLDGAVDYIAGKGDIRVLGLTGPTCSGKTTAAKKLISFLEDSKKRVHTVSLDDFFKESFSRSQLDGLDPSKIDFDSPDTLDIEELDRFVGEIFSRGVSRKPVFDFVSGERVRYDEIVADGDDVFIFEGIQVLYPAVISVIERSGGSIIGVRPQSGIIVEDRVLEPNFIRLCRRLVRDYNFRGASPEFTFAVWDGVRRNEEENIFPHIDKCDIEIDTTLEYEINILAPYLRRVLGGMSENDPHYKKSREILEMFEGIEGAERDWLSKTSLYREFV